MNKKRQKELDIKYLREFVRKFPNHNDVEKARKELAELEGK